MCALWWCASAALRHGSCRKCRATVPALAWLLAGESAPLRRWKAVGSPAPAMRPRGTPSTLSIGPSTPRPRGAWASGGERQPTQQPQPCGQWWAGPGRSGPRGLRFPWGTGTGISGPRAPCSRQSADGHSSRPRWAVAACGSARGMHRKSLGGVPAIPPFPHLPSFPSMGAPLILKLAFAESREPNEPAHR